MNYAQDPDTFLTSENLAHLHKTRRAFFRPPRGNPGAPGSLTRRLWTKHALEVRDAGRAYHNGEVSFHEAARRALQAHLELEQFRNEHGKNAPKERRSVLLTRKPVALSEPEEPDWVLLQRAARPFFPHVA